MKIMVVHLGDFMLCPPAINVVENLVDHEHEVMLVTYNAESFILPELFKNKGKLIVKDLGPYIYPQSNIKRYEVRLKSRNVIRKYIKDNIDNYDRIWTTSEITVREIGDILLNSNTKHIMQLMELTDYVPRFGGYKLFQFNIEKYAQHAYKVVVPEYNRAHIVKTKWHLNQLPEILPNKPYYIDISENSLSDKAQNIIAAMEQEEKKIVLYQGGFTKDRKFDQFAEAINKLDGYALYFMGKDNAYRKKICEQYPSIHYLGFLNPPEHLVIAKYAHIGILTYHPVKDNFYSDLNAVFCAPNKTFEYALCELPMIGTDVPGLMEIFEKYKIGCCISEDSPDGVIGTIKEVENNYNEMKINCKTYFDSVDLKKIVAKILK